MLKDFSCYSYNYNIIIQVAVLAPLALLLVLEARGVHFDIALILCIVE